MMVLLFAEKQTFIFIELVSSPGESHPKALSEPYVNVSAHTAPIIQPVITALS
jgi:hypothetical protein